MSDLNVFLTNDGSFSLRSNFFQENFHSRQGAYTETKIKFTNPSNLTRFKGKSLAVLDICFGLGYNSAALFNELITQGSFLDWYALEIDKRPLEYTVRNKYFLKFWDPKINKIFESLNEKDFYEDQFFKCRIIWGEARKKIDNIPPNVKFDLIYLDGFSPQKCPQVWTVEFLSKVIQKLKENGYLITYTSSAAVRKSLRKLGLEIFSIKPTMNFKNQWSQGTVAIARFDKNKAQESLFIQKLSPMEEEHLLTKASIPYRDPHLMAENEDIIQERLKEQKKSKLLSSRQWREKWK